jgi:predicted nicotinamide N-methyase
MPYWGLLWPSGLALAEELMRGDFVRVSDVGASGGCAAKLRVLELGCGLGVTAIAAQATGLSLTAADCFPEALAFCRYNSVRNLGWMPKTLLVDWRTASGRAALALAPAYDVLLAADVLYEEPDIALLLELAPRLVKPGGRFWLAEPGRRVSLKFVEEALAFGWRDTLTVAERLWPPDSDYARVTIHRFTFS